MSKWFTLAAAFLVSPVLLAQSYLVLPFVNTTGDESLGWVGESAASAITEALALRDVLVVERAPRNEVMRRLALRRDARLTRASVLKAAQAADAAVVVSGSVAREGDVLRLTCEMIDSRRLVPLASFREEAPPAELSVLTRRLAWSVLNTALPGKLPVKEEFVRAAEPIRTEALEQYVRGLNSSQADQRIAAWTAAARSAPRFAAPAYELGLLYAGRKQWQEAALWLSRLTSDFAYFRRATFQLGVARYHLNDFAGAEAAFAQVAASVPLAEVLNNWGVALLRRGSPASLERFEQALENDAADPVYHFNAGLFLYRRGSLAAAADRFRAVLDRAPSDVEALEMLGRCLKPGAENRSQTAVGWERIKSTYDEAAFLQLKALTESRRP